MPRWTGYVLAACLSGIGACGTGTDRPPARADGSAPAGGAESSPAARLGRYTTVRLTAELAGLSERERQMIPHLIAAAAAMDTVYRRQYYPALDSLLRTATDSAERRLLEINYGPWDRLDDDRPFVPGFGARPPGAALYPPDATKQELERHPELLGEYTVVRRDRAGHLSAVPYHEAFAEGMSHAATHLREAAALAEDPGLRRYLELRARALETDNYQPSDLAWLDIKDNTLDIVVGPIETYIDQLMGRKTAAESYVLIKDKAWSKRLARYASLLPALQRGLPVPEAYKRERPGTDSDLNAYDAVYYAGDGNAGSKTIAINLPNDEEVQRRKGTRRLQLKNVMQAKFERILVPIADQLIVEDQRPRITFDAFFANVMFHEVAHGLGITRTLDGKGTVRQALKEQAGALEEGKADILGLYMITRLLEQHELTGTTLEDHYVTFLASIFRSIRFGAAEAHGRANAAQLSYFEEHGAFARDSATGRYRVDFPRMRQAVDSLAGLILRFQGDGDYAGVARFMAQRATPNATVRADLSRLGGQNVPVDVVFEQGAEVLGLGR